MTGRRPHRAVFVAITTSALPQEFHNSGISILGSQLSSNGSRHRAANRNKKGATKTRSIHYNAVTKMLGVVVGARRINMPESVTEFEFDVGGDGDRIRVRFAADGKTVLRFAVQYETIIDDSLVPIVRYDTAHELRIATG